MQGLVIVGSQWGDEGKGKIVDSFAARAHGVVRFQGGNNAGHSLKVGNRETVLHLIPSGILHPKSQCIIGSGVVVDPEVFLEEVRALRAQGTANLEGRLWLSDRAHLILDYHKALDAAKESGAAGIGTTKRGIGPAYSDRAWRSGIRLQDLLDPQGFEKKYQANLLEKNLLIAHHGHPRLTGGKEAVQRYQALAASLRPFITDTHQVLQNLLKKKKRIVFEGAQGILLDIDYGTYPFVTSSHTLPAQAALGSGCPLPKSTHVLGVFKAYATRVGQGPFPTEMQGEVAENLRKAGGEYGATTGRPRRCGWLDLVALRHAVQIAGIDSLAITKADILGNQEWVQVCTKYRIGDRILPSLPSHDALLKKAQPIYQKLKGWGPISSGNVTYAKLPKPFRDFVGTIEKFVGVPVSVVSYGPDRKQTLERIKFF